MNEKLRNESAGSPITKTLRLLDLVPYLVTHQGSTIQTLASFFSVTREQIVDDLNTLWMCGLADHRFMDLIELSFDGDVVSISNAEPLYPVRSLSHSEILILVFGLEILESHIEVAGVLAKPLIAELVSKLRKILGSVSSSLGVIVDNDHTEVTELILQAIAMRSSIVITYHSSNDDETIERRIKPFQLYEKNGFTYLDGFCFVSQDSRTFRVDRMSSLILDTSKAIEDDELWKGRIFQESHELLEAELMFSSSLRRNSDRFAIAPGLVTAGKPFKSSFFSDKWLIRSVLAGGGSVHLVGSPLLRRKIAEEAKKALALYHAP